MKINSSIVDSLSHYAPFFIICHQDFPFSKSIKESLFTTFKLERLAEALKDYSQISRMNIYRNACDKIKQKIINTSHFRTRYPSIIGGEYRNTSCIDEPRAKIHVFCPPLLDYIHIALAFSPPDPALRTCLFQVVIHPDHRLRDEKVHSADEARESLSQLCDFVYSNGEQGLGEPIDDIVLPLERERRSRFLAARFDQVWMDRCMMAASMDERLSDPIDFSQIFREYQDDNSVQLMVVMAGPQVCNNITSIPPVAGPGYPMQPLQIYKLEKVSDGSEHSVIRWKTLHFGSMHRPHESRTINDSPQHVPPVWSE